MSTPEIEELARVMSEAPMTSAQDFLHSIAEHVVSHGYRNVAGAPYRIAPVKPRRGRPPVSICHRGHDQTTPGARGKDGKQCLACKAINKAAVKAKKNAEAA